MSAAIRAGLEKGKGAEGSARDRGAWESQKVRRGLHARDQCGGRSAGFTEKHLEG